ncbi:MAG TPA: Uma2 family endonuclease [Anaerolineae bacterium]|nr:Uma2 family endonuclease [Anaerolineae bacterium]HXV97816.1 Uma2 family endonuclease [Anaerolineae bacterium]
MSVQILKRLFTVGEYHQMIEAGILAEDDRVELIEGEVIEISPIGSRHAACVKRLNQLFAEQLGKLALISVQDPIHLNEQSEPEPDLALLQARADFYVQAHPEPEDILLVVEVAETSIEYDQQVKLPLYARNGIAEVWLVHLAAHLIEVYRQPAPAGYGQIQQLRRGESLSPQAFPQLDLTVDEILGQA